MVGRVERLLRRTRCYGRLWPDHDRRPLAVATRPRRLHLGLLGDLQGVVDLDPEVSDRALQLGVPKEELNRPEISGPPVDQRGFGAPQRMGAVSRRVEPSRYAGGTDLIANMA